MTIEDLRTEARRLGCIVVPVQNGITLGPAPIKAPVDDNGEPCGDGFAIYVDGLSSEDARLIWNAAQKAD